MNKKYNMIHILCDDMGSWAMGNSGNREIRTPHIDSLAAGGMKLNNCYCVSPVCSPARASLFTGRIPSSHGVLDWIAEGNSPVDNREERCIDYLAGAELFTDLMAEAGYQLGYSGKWHLGDAPTPRRGHSFWYAHARGGGPYYGAEMYKEGELIREKEYITDRITEEGLQFLEQAVRKDAPFCLTLSYTAPHSPWDRGNHPEDLFDDYYKSCPFESVPYLPLHPWHINTASVGYNREKRREILSGYYAAVTAMDTNIGRLLHWLREKNLEEETIVFFTSDNGMNMGHHGIYGKGNGTFPQNMFETSVKVPAILSCPSVVPAGVVLETPVSHYDVFPTVMDFLGVNEERNLPGTSWLKLLNHPGDASERPVVIFSEYGPVRMIRKGRYKYIHRFPYGPHEFYDLEEDPEEFRNLYGYAEYDEQVRMLRKELKAWFLQHSDPEKDGIKEAVYGKGQCGIIAPDQVSDVFRDDMIFIGDAGESVKDFNI